jgi:hypothetical protein
MILPKRVTKSNDDEKWVLFLQTYLMVPAKQAVTRFPRPGIAQRHLSLITTHTNTPPNDPRKAASTLAYLEEEKTSGSGLNL